MALLFISYKRGDDGVQNLKERLKAADYNIWFDRESILISDPDWQESIERGIQEADGVILCMSPRALTSEYIKSEVRVALSHSKPVFPLLVDKVEDVADALRQLGMPERHQVEDLYTQDTWEATFEKLLNNLQVKRILPGDGQCRTRSQKHSLLHENYLRHTIDVLGKVDVREVNPAFDSPEMFIEDLFVPLRTDFRLVLSIKNYDVERWWCCHWEVFDEPRLEDRVLKDDEIRALDEAHKKLFGKHTWNLDAIERMIQNRRESLDKQSQEDRRRRMARLDEAFEVIALDVYEVATMTNHMLLLGEAGMGKTTFCQYIASCLAGDQIANFSRDLNRKRLRNWMHGALTPVYIKMYWLMDYIDRYGWNADAFDACVKERLEDPAYFVELQSDLNNGCALICIDGLERALDVGTDNLKQRQADVVSFLNSLSTKYGASRLIVTGRPTYFTNWIPAGFTVCHVTPLPYQRRTTLATRLYISRRSVAAMDAPQVADQLSEFLSQFSLELSGNPRFVTLLSSVYPEKRGVLYRRTVDLLVDSWTQPRPGLPSITQVMGRDMPPDEAKKLISEIVGAFAYESIEMFEQAVPSGRPLRRLLWGYLGELALRRHDVNLERLSAYLSENAGIFAGFDDTFHFAHEGFRQYFAAEHLRRQFLEKEPDGFKPFIRRLIEENANIWSNAVLLMSDLLVADHAGRITDVLNLLDQMLNDEIPENPDDIHPDDPHLACVWLAGKIAVEEDIRIDRLSRREQRFFEDVIDWLKLLVEKENAPSRPGLPNQPDLLRRAEAGRFLGILGDHRRGINVEERNGLPDVLWITIPGGTFKMGSDPDVDKYEAFDVPGPVTVEVNTFYLSKYPVTYAQYKAFVNDGGYTDSRYWSQDGWQWLDGRVHPQIGWDDAFAIDNHPVVGVSWYEAQAFCCWLTERLGFAVRLPTEAEWERAARADTNDRFPYGDDFMAEYANTRRTGVGCTTAVGLFPQGDSPYGVSDMSGNVYEWCADEVKEVPSGTGVKRVLKGGSWQSYPGFTRLTHTYSDYPYFATGHWGFRLAADNVT